MIKVYNPIYDSVFKYLMEDERVSKIIQSKTHLNELLRLPDQTQAVEDKFIVLDDNMDSSPEYQEIMKALIKATSDAKVQGDINFEDEMEREFAVRDQAIVDLKAEVDEKAKQLTTTIQMLKNLGIDSKEIAKQLNISESEVDEKYILNKKTLSNSLYFNGWRKFFLELFF